MASENDGWVRPLAKFEVFLEILHQHGFMITCYSLDLNSSLPLKEIHIKKALLHLLRKVPSLGVCIRPKDGKDLWFHKLESESIDFKVLGNADFQKEYEAMTVHHYNSFDGPLWCSRLLPLPQGSPCPMPEVMAKFPHHYKFLFGFHHSITDGTSSIKICNMFLNLLNDVIAGKSINDFEQLADHISPEVTEKIQAQVGAELVNNPGELAKYQAMLKGSVEEVLLLKAYPPPNNVSPKTLNLSYSLSEEETTKFMSRCKTEGVTLHSGFCSVINAALVDMLIKAGFNEEPFKIKNYHSINNRRYWEGDTSRAFGAHIGKITLISEVTSDIRDFWNQARSFHQTLASLLNDKGPFKESIAMFMSIPQNADITKLIDEMPMGDNYYGTTNMGNLAKTFPGEGDHVQATGFQRTTSTTKNLCSHVMQTFRGRFLYGIDYEAQLMSTETAQLYVNTIFQKLRVVSCL